MNHLFRTIRTPFAAAMLLAFSCFPVSSRLACAQAPAAGRVAEESPAAATQSEKPIKALLVTGGCCHDYDRQKLIIPKGLSQRANIQWTVIQQGGSTTNTKIPLYEDPNWAEGFDVVVHNECFAGVADPEWAEVILAPHRAGTPAVLIHCAMHCYRVGSDAWFEFCGVRSPGHGPHYPFRVENIAPEHPVMQGFGAGWDVPKGELYHVPHLFSTATPLGQAIRKSDGQPQVCVWTNQYHKARVFATTIGHYNETMAQPVYLDMLTRGLLWAVHGEQAPAIQPTGEDQHQEVLALVNIPKPGAADQQLDNPCCGDDDLLRGKPATASSEETAKNNFAKNAVDGLLNTRWCANGPAKGESLVVDLQSSQEVASLRIHWEQEGTVYRYQVLGSDDGQHWRTIVDASQNEQKQRIVSHRLDAQRVRYLKVEFLGTSSGSWGSIWEVEAYAGELPALPASVAAASGPAATTADVKAPADFDVRMFAAPPQVGYPVCITTGAQGEVFVGVDEQGSLGKESGRGRVLRCLDIDGDGVADRVNTFATMDHPRGLHFDNGKLWVLHPPLLTLFEDLDGDGEADREQVLVTGLSTDQVAKRGADHTTNGIRMGIDGWIYIAVGDFGFTEATGSDGTRLARRGGGIVRVRPDGTELEVFSWGQRNILDVCIDPYLNMFTRDNTNDGGGWDIRVTHILQGADYGYPSKYLHYADETMPPLADYGGGSGCGAMYVFEPRWPREYGQAAYTCDWGTSKVYRHRLPEAGPSYLADQDVFLDLPRPTDIEMDASGRMFVSSWKRGGFSYSDENVGFVAQLTPREFLPKPFPILADVTDHALVELLRDGATARTIPAQHELLRRGAEPQRADLLRGLCDDAAAPLAGRVAALFTLKQLLGTESHDYLSQVSAAVPELRAFALRALTDRRSQLAYVPVESYVRALTDDNPRVRGQALIGLKRLADCGAIEDVATVAQHVLPLSVIRDASGEERVNVVSHKLGDVDRVLPHLAMQTLIALQAGDACLQALDSPHRSGALRTLRNMHLPVVIDGVLARLEATSSTTAELSESERVELLDLLARLYYREGEYLTGDWWGTRPDTSGPYYDRQRWSQSSRIANVLIRAGRSESTAVVDAVQESIKRYKISLGAGEQPVKMKAEEQQAIAIIKADPNNPNLVGNMKAADVIARVLAQDGDAERGQAYFVSQSCGACHTSEAGQTPKGPHLVDIGKRYKKAELLESLLMPSAKLAQGFETWSFLTVDGRVQTGFVVTESAETVTIRQNDGVAIEIVQSEIETRKRQEISMMPEGVVDSLTAGQIADLIAYLQSLKSQ
ncbi:DUF7133 domain-containing protein [Planctomycetaceae bacterium SH139]